MQQPSEQEIAALISLINQQEIALSEIALQKSYSPDVQRYAEQMIDEHSRAEQHGTRLSRGARVSLEACPQCEQLQTSAVETRESLQEQEGAEFDASFMWAQISLHRRALEILDERLVERMKDANLRSQVIKMRSDIERHLSDAEQIFCALQQRQQQQSGQYQRDQQQGPQKSAQQQGPQSAQQQHGQQQGPQSAQQQRGQQHGPQSAQQQRGQQHGPQSAQQQRGQQHGPQYGQHRGGHMRGQQSARQQGSGQRGQQL